MKKLLITTLFIVLTTHAFSQQYLWSTIKNDSLPDKYVPLNEVTEKVLPYYEYYEYYYDLTGFTKESFIEQMGENPSDYQGFWSEAFEEFTVIALKSNDGYGSAISIICIDKDNIDIVTFTNTLEIS